MSLKKDAKPKAPRKVTERPEENTAVRFGRALLGQDGNIYLMRASSPAMVYVISPSGNLVRTVGVQSPFEKAVPVTLLIDAGRLAIEFTDPASEDTSDTTIRVADSLTGEKLADYR